jgi:hypothetical protein
MRFAFAIEDMSRFSAAFIFAPCILATVGASLFAADNLLLVRSDSVFSSSAIVKFPWVGGNRIERRPIHRKLFWPFWEDQPQGVGGVAAAAGGGPGGGGRRQRGGVQRRSSRRDGRGGGIGTAAAAARGGGAGAAGGGRRRRAVGAADVTMNVKARLVDDGTV